jgi:hypothetical protein
MSSTHDFLRAVLPSRGVYCAVGIRNGKARQEFFESRADIERHALALDSKAVDAYFALASFRDEARGKENTAYMRSVFVDIDCGEGKPYATKRDGVTALSTFLEDTHTPQPWVVDSGNGIHAYWTFDDDVKPNDWLPTAEAFKRLCLAKGLHIDQTVTADRARILRVPATRNWKKADAPKQVRLRCEAPALSFAQFTQHVQAFIPQLPTPAAHKPAPALQLEGTPLVAASTIKLIENSVTNFKTIMLKSLGPDNSGCQQMRYYVEHAAEQNMEGMWRAMLSIAKYCEDGDKAAVKLSSLHPYDAARTAKKLADIKGPYSCAKIEGENLGGCDECKHVGKITNPLFLGRAVLTNNAPTTIVAKDEAGVSTVPNTVDHIKYHRPAPPKGYSFGANGGIYVKRRNEEGDMIEYCITHADVFVANTMSSGGISSMQIVSRGNNGKLKTLILQSEHLISQADTLRALAARGIIPCAGGDKDLYFFIRGLAVDMQASRDEMVLPDAYGWQNDGSFVINHTRIDAFDSTPVPMDDSQLDNIRGATSCKGNLLNWRTAVNVLVARQNIDMLCALSVSFGSVLLTPADSHMPGLCVTLHSDESGTGKSLAQEYACSVWGEGKAYRYAPTASVVAMEHRMGMLHNLPFIVDEVTSNVRNGNSTASVEWVPTFLLNLTQGKGKERLNPNDIQERRNTTYWQLMTLMSTNSSMIDTLMASRHTQEGALHRLLEIRMDDEFTLKREEEPLVSLLQNNYGVAGRKYVQWLAGHRDEVKNVVDAIREKVRNEVQQTGKERFWVEAVAAMIAGAVLAGPRFADIVELPHRAMFNYMCDIIRRSRKEKKASARTALDVFSEFLQKHYGNLIIVRNYNNTTKLDIDWLTGVKEESQARSQVKGRVELGFTPGVVSVYITPKVFTQHCAESSYSVAGLRRDLSKHFIVTESRKNIFADTRIRMVSRDNSIRFDIPETHWEHVMGPDADPASIDPVAQN